MIDDAFLRQVAALQANLKMLESQSDALSDLADMKELRLYKSRLSDYIEAQASAGELPRDPFRVVEQRLIALSEFFTAADQEYQRLKGWKADWLNSVPAVSLADLQSARTELAERLAEVPQIQDRLAQRLSPLDWDDSSATVDLHADLMGCAMCVSGLKILQKPAERIELYQFTRGVGELAKKTSAHFTAMGLRIEDLIALHAGHGKAVAEGEALLAKQNFRSAGKMLEKIGKNKFSDIHYFNLESGLKEQLALAGKFAALASSIKERLTKGELKSVKEELGKLRALAGNPASEFGHETSELLKDADAQMASFLRGRKKRTLIATVLLVIGVTGAAALAGYVIEEEKKATLAKIKAEAAYVESSTLAKIKAEAAYVESSGKRAGEEKVIEISPGVSMTFCWCPAGKFTMGSPGSEADRSSDEDQVEVTLSLGFWMAKTEVTQAQWQAVMGNNPSKFKGANRPVEYVSWNDAQEFLTKVNAIVGNSDGGKMVLPTEAQWEYAARSGETDRVSGDTLNEVAWYSGNSGRETHPVGTKNPNAWGLDDMIGNVWEWCADWYESELKAGIDPRGAASGANRVGRGGGWSAVAINCRVAFRYYIVPASQNDGIGFRVARSSVLQSQ